MLDKAVERKLRQAVLKRGGLCWKFVSPGTNGVPDRIIMLDGGICTFVETKASGKTMRALQVKRKKQLETLGFKVYCLDGIEQIGGMLDEIEKG